MLKKSLLLSLFSLVVSLISMGNQLLIAHQFGSSTELNTYLVISGIPLFISGSIVAAFNYSLTPLLLAQEKSISYSQERNSSTISTIIFALLVTITGLVCSLPFYNNSSEIATDTTSFWRLLILSNICCILNIFIGYLNSVAAASFKFNVPFIASSLPYFFVIFFCYYLSDSLGTLSIIGGLVMGNLIGIIVIAFYLGKSKLFPDNASGTISKQMINYFQKFPLVLMGMLGFTVFSAIDIVWTQGLGESKLAYLSYCQKMIVSIGSLIIAGPSSMLTPYLAKQLLEDSILPFFNTMEKCLRLLIIISVFAVVNLFIYAKPITTLLFERGQFTKLDSLQVASILPFFGIGMMLMVNVVIMFRAIMVKKDLISGAKIGIVIATCYFVFSGFYVRYYDFQGISYAYITSWLIGLILTIKLLWKEKIGLLVNKKMGLFLLKMMITILIMIIPLNALDKYFFLDKNLNTFQLFISLTEIFILSGSLFIFLLLFMKIEETEIIKRIPVKKLF